MTSNNESSIDLTAQGLVALRNEPDALRIIIGRLRVKEMGPADHIHTKHEVKAFLESGAHNLETAEDIIRRARIRLEERRQQLQSLLLNQQQSMNQSMRQQQTNGHYP